MSWSRTETLCTNKAFVNIHRIFTGIRWGFAEYSLLAVSKAINMRTSKKTARKRPIYGYTFVPAAAMQLNIPR